MPTDERGEARGESCNCESCQNARLGPQPPPPNKPARVEAQDRHSKEVRTWTIWRCYRAWTTQPNNCGWWCGPKTQMGSDILPSGPYYFLRYFWLGYYPDLEPAPSEGDNQ